MKWRCGIWLRRRIVNYIGRRQGELEAIAVWCDRWNECPVVEAMFNEVDTRWS